MINWILNIRKNNKVRYMMENGDNPVMAEMPFRDALKRLPQKEVKISRKFDGFPLTVDDKYFFEGEAEEVEI